MPMLSHRRMMEREIKSMLLEVAKKHLDPSHVSEWLREEFGLNTRGDWRSIERALMSPEVTSNEFAVFLEENGIKIPEERWFEILRRYGIRV